MSAITFLLIALVISIVGTMVVLVRNRTAESVDSGIDDFRREMQALAPRANGYDDRGRARSRRV
ncbi:MAG TPA: hypothetical protein VIL48_10725 [Acidimicrobiales bacterium]